MLQNLWKNIVPVCCCNHEETPMQLIQGPSSLFYACPRYYPDNRAAGEKACPNRINLVDYQKMAEHFSQEIEEGMMNGQKEDLTNEIWNLKKQVDFKVLEHKKGLLKVSIYNKKAFR